ncbi:DUF6343 family protein [Streptomyces sp. NPDC005500]|uniref:DUF6343 family protein n=2 Tax=unclassified Streptomyces TaxID=2593676 RepID=UPI0033BE344D
MLVRSCAHRHFTGWMHSRRGRPVPECCQCRSSHRQLLARCRSSQICVRPFPDTASLFYAMGDCQVDVLQLFRACRATPWRPENPAGHRTCHRSDRPRSEVSSMSQIPPHEPRDDRQFRSSKRHRRAGTEPLTARSDLGLRTILSTAALVVFGLATAGFAWWAASSSKDSSTSSSVLGVLAAVCGVLLLVAVLDLAVIRRRRSGQRG